MYAGWSSGMKRIEPCNRVPSSTRPRARSLTDIHWFPGRHSRRTIGTDARIKFFHQQNGTVIVRPMERATASLEKIVANRLRSAPAGEGPVLAWPLACGTSVSGRTRPLDFSQGILTVEVPDAGWRTELQSLAPQYLAVINRYTAESVKRIEFVLPGRKQS